MSHGHGSVDYVRKFFVLFCLFASLLSLYHIAPNSGQGVGLLALGFVILSAFLIGQVVEIIKLPHITGYLLAGVFLGPSLGETLHKINPQIHLLPPFDHGILNFKVIENLALLDTLALPLICITAGGALQPKEIKKAFKPILGVLTGQVLAMFIGMIGLFYLMSGPLPFLTLPALQNLSLPAILGLGAVVAAISIATSDAATIAIVVGMKAKGPMTTNIVSVAVLKDIVVVIAFAATTVIATSALGLDSGGSLGNAIFLIFLSSILGIALGYLIRLYLRYINAELLLFAITLIYTVSFVCDYFHLESALLFIAAGFIVANGPDKGGRFIVEIEKLSTPVFVVFFTIAGAKLHLDVLVEMALFAFVLVFVRSLAFYIGCRVGSVLTNADAATRDYAWMGFVSQAGLAITLANTFPTVYGPELGGALFSFILGGVAIHEIIGPALLQLALQKANELPTSSIDEKETTEQEELSSSNSFTDIQLSKFSQNIQNILDNQLEHIETAFQHRLDAIKNGNLELSTLLESFDSTLITKIDQQVETLPQQIYVDVEEISFTKNMSDSWFQNLRRHLQRIHYQFKPWKREIDLRNLARYHVGGIFIGSLKSIFLEMSRLERSWALSQTEQNFDLTVLQKDRDVFLDGVRRRFRIIHHHFVQDLRLISTIDLRAWQRRTSLIFEERNNTHIFLSKDLPNYQIHIQVLWQKVQLQIFIRTQMFELLEGLKSRHITLPMVPESNQTNYNWQESFEIIKQISSNVALISHDILKYLQNVFSNLPNTLVFTPATIDISREMLEPQQIQLQSNLAHLMDQKIQIELPVICSPLTKILSKYLSLHSEIIEIYERELDEMLLQSIHRKQNRIVEKHLDVEKVIQQVFDQLHAFILEISSQINEQFSSQPKHSQLLIETSNLWQELLFKLQTEFYKLKRDFYPIELPDYTQLFRNEKLGYENSFSDTLLKECSVSLMSSTESILFVGSPTQITQIIKECKEELPYHTSDPSNLQIQNNRRNVFLYEDISHLQESQIQALEDFILNKNRVIIGVSRYHWAYLQQRYSVHKIISQVRILPSFSPTLLRKIILHRHNFSGYNLKFSSNHRYIFDHLMNISPQKRFFIWLHQISKGDINVAYTIWQRSIRAIEDDTLIIDYGNVTNIISHIDDENLILLRQALRFSNVNAKNIQYWYGCTEKEAKIKITSLLQDNLFELQVEKDGQKYYRIPLDKQPLIEQVLHKHGWSL